MKGKKEKKKAFIGEGSEKKGGGSKRERKINPPAGEYFARMFAHRRILTGNLRKVERGMHSC